MLTATRIVNVRKEPYDICIMRPGYYKNRFVIGVHGTREEVIKLFEIEFIRLMKTDSFYLMAIERLRGKVLGCCCSPEPCHGDVYINYFQGKYDSILTNIN